MELKVNISYFKEAYDSVGKNSSKIFRNDPRTTLCSKWKPVCVDFKTIVTLFSRYDFDLFLPIFDVEKLSKNGFK